MNKWYADFWKSWKYAWNGIKYCFGIEQNLTIMVIIAAMVIILGLFLHISKTEWFFILIMISAILALELFNTSLEHFLDLFHPEINEQVGHIKDLMAGSLAIASLGAATIGFIIFMPKIINFIKTII